MKVLLATDGSPHAEFAAATLCRLPHADPLDLTVMTTVILPDVGTDASSTAWSTEFLEQQQKVAQEHFAHVERMFEGANATLRHKMSEGHVGQSIIVEAEQSGADLIVVGAKGHSTVERILLGSVSDFVATHASCTVLVVRPAVVDRPLERFHVTIAYDGSAPSEAAVDQFTQFGWGPATECHLLRVLPRIRSFAEDVLPAESTHRSDQQAAAASANERTAERLRSAAPRTQTHVIEADHVPEAIVSFAASHHADLVILGSTGHSALHRILLGSVSRYVLRHAATSVWIARNKK